MTLAYLSTLAYNTQKIREFLAIQPVRFCLWHTENIVQWSTLQCGCQDHKLQTIHSTLELLHVIKCTRLIPFLQPRNKVTALLLIVVAFFIINFAAREKSRNTP